MEIMKEKRMTMKTDFEEVLLGEKRSKSDIKKFNRRFYIMVVVASLGLFLVNQIWHFKDDMSWYAYIIGGFLITAGILLYIYIYKSFLRSRHKIWYAIFIFSMVLFKLLPYILGWKKF
jgi:predicted membrane channel-forming protein YqfA (hemolysin III family)